VNVALVNPFDPLPGDEVRQGRYAAFARALVAAGHAVTWYSSDFSHTLKCPRDIQRIPAAGWAAGIVIELIPTLPYPGNVCWARLRSHRKFAGEVRRRLEAAEPAPDVVVVSAPPPGLAAAVTDAAHRRSARVILDVQDLWPETFARIWPGPLRWLSAVAGRPMARAMRHAENHADVGIGVAEEYRLHFERHARPGTPSHVLHLGADLAEFDRYAEAPLPPVPPAAADKRWILVGGMLLGTALHWPFLLDLAAALGQRRLDVHIMVAGSGAMADVLRAAVAARKLANVHLLGFQPYPAFCALATRSDFGLNHCRADSFAYFPNRVFDYFAADLPVINTVGGELANLLKARQVGFTTTTFDAAAAAEYVARTIATRPEVTNRPAPNARRARWVTEFDRPAIARRLVEIVEGQQFARP
jgi:glycosyltransferase involved in cell wall biosynthesis